MATANEIVLIPTGATLGDVARFDGTRWQRVNEITTPIAFWPFSFTNAPVSGLAVQRSVASGWTWGGTGTAGSPANLDGPWGGIVLTAENGAEEEIFTGAYAGVVNSGTLVFQKITKLGLNPTLYMRAKFSDTTAEDIILGAVESRPNDSWTPDGWYFKYTHLDANFKAITRNGGVSTTTDTGIAADTSYHNFTIVATASPVKFYIDGSLVATHTTNLDTADMGLTMAVTYNDIVGTDTLSCQCASLRQNVV